MRFFMDRARDFDAWRLAQDVVWEKHNGSGFDADRFKRVHEIVAQFYPGDVPWASVYRSVQKVPGEARPTAAIASRADVKHRRKIGAGGYTYGDERLMRSVIWARSCHGRAVHETQKPEAVLVPLVRYSCPVGGVVLDPFCGSGSTGLAAQLAGVDFIGVELRPHVAAMARRRLSGDVRGDAPLLAAVASELA
jgi:site-specific DNA-methyltransferase (adenine-specific)